MKALVGTLILSVLCARATAAAPLTRPLAPGLTYLRVTALPADLAAPSITSGQSWVLDLRYTPDSPGDSPALTHWLQMHATVRTPVLVLANAATGPGLRQVLTARPAPNDTLVLGVPAPGFAPDIAIHADAAEARQAYDALPAAADIQNLISYTPPKTRFDEQSMIKARQERKDLNLPPAGDDDQPDDDAPAAAAAPNPPSAPPLLDHALQRAVQIYEGWQALHPN